MPMFHRKPVVVEAWCNTEDLPHRSPPPDWLRQAINDGTIWIGGGLKGFLNVRTVNGRVRAEYGDWIVRDADGKLLPCKPDVFAATYEAV